MAIFAAAAKVNILLTYHPYIYTPANLGWIFPCILTVDAYLGLYKFCCNSYSPGDVLMIQPSNLSDVADEFINHLGLNPNQKILLSQNYPGKFLQNTSV